MSREEEIKQAAEHYEQVDATNLACDYGWGDRDIQQQCFKAGVEWADEHPREGLWDAEKVISFLKEHATVENSSNINFHINGACYHFVNDFIEDFRKVMED